ncbi:MAG: ABC transporter permease [Ignisphaera sp.]|uniref:ABC transporter permease n=1 Tax=Ignisphaera aggregans TaxID=334771 RepID=A0A7C4JIC0_9CREN
MGDLKKYVLRRSITFLPTILGILLLTFLISHIIPADPVRVWAGGYKAKPEVIEEIRRRYHLDKPLHEQLLLYLRDVFAGNWGTSPMTKRPVLADLAEYFPATLELAIVSTLLLAAMGVPLGLLAAFKKDSVVDNIVRILALAGTSAPAFWLAITLQWVLYYSLGVLPATGRGVPPPARYTGMYLLDSLLNGNIGLFVENLRYILMPSITLAFTGMGIVARVVRNTTLDTMSSDFIDFAKARGLRGLQLYKHLLKNVLIPTITILSLEVGYILSGVIVIETVFAWPGIGLYAYNAISSLDYPAVMGVTLLTGFVFVLINFVTDIAYAVIDPRVRL